MYSWMAVLVADPSGLNRSKHAILLDQLTRLFHGFGWAVTIVATDEVGNNLATINAALFVDHVGVGGLGFA